MPLGVAVRLLPTPRASDGTKGSPHGSKGDLTLPSAALNLPHRQPPSPGGAYEPAILGWETILGRPAPQPTETGTRGQPRLSARFVEWMMGLPAGWVTDLPLTRAAQMRLLGNGVVPQQAIAAFLALDGNRPTDTRDSAGGGS
jgi:DNA (cytosine-5)-methyltransferase 1